MPHFDADPSRPAAYEAIRDLLLAAAETSPVFFKDMSYYVVPRIFEDPDFTGRLTNSFLIRDPLRSLLSYYKLDPDMTLEEIGLEAQWTHFRWLRETTGAVPLVVEAEAVQRDVEGQLGAYWARVGLPFAPHAFAWDRRDAPKDWEQVAGWHGEVASSGGIRPPEDPPEEAALRAKFDSKARAAPRLRAYLEHHRPFYEKLRGFAVQA